MENNYYTVLLTDIKTFIENEDFQSAARLINEELTAPYIPKEVEEKLKEFNRVVANYFINSVDSSFLTWNIDKVTEVMKQNVNQEMHLLAFNALRGLNARLIIPTIKKYLLDNSIRDDFKTFLMMILIEQKIDEEFLVKKNNNKIEITFNPSTFDVLESNQFLAELELQLELLVNINNPSLYSVCKSYATAYFYNVFPIFRLDVFTINDVLAFIIMISQKALGLDWENGINNLFNYNHDKALLLMQQYQDIF